MGYKIVRIGGKTRVGETVISPFVDRDFTTLLLTPSIQMLIYQKTEGLTKTRRQFCNSREHRYAHGACVCVCAFVCVDKDLYCTTFPTGQQRWFKGIFYTMLL